MSGPLSPERVVEPGTGGGPATVDADLLRALREHLELGQHPLVPVDPVVTRHLLERLLVNPSTVGHPDAPPDTI